MVVLRMKAVPNLDFSTFFCQHHSLLRSPSALPTLVINLLFPPLILIAGTMNAEVAETVELVLPALPCSPSLEVTHDSADYGAADVYEDSEYPYAPGCINGVKCCTKCGAIKTPQWREGPFGPKTLCNACGVKRTRKLRAEQDGNKRRRLTASPAKQYTTKAAPKPVYSHGKLLFFSLFCYFYHRVDAYTNRRLRCLPPNLIKNLLSYHIEIITNDADALDGYDSQGYEEDGYADAAYYHPSPIKRPQRRAAEEAAVKTARYARTGEWAKQDAMSHQLAPVATPSSSSDYSLPESDCPEEVSFTPLAAEAAARSGLPGFPSDCYAAVNLMTMSFRQPDDVAQSVGGSSAAPRATIPDANTAYGLVEEALLAKAAETGFDAGAVTDLYKTLPPAKVVELVRLNQDLDAAIAEFNCANTAVAAVAAALATKQAAALRSKENALAATKRLRRFVVELDTQVTSVTVFTYFILIIDHQQ